jgi:hypothetical protein
MHVLIVGVAFSGKSWLAKRLAVNAGPADVIVYDPTESHGWPGHARKYSGPESFLFDVEGARNAYVFIDEARTLWNFDADRADKLVYTGRHRGLLFVLIAQRAKMIPPNARNQCSRIYAFKQQYDDARILAGDYHDGLMAVSGLPKLHFLASDGFDLTAYRLDFSTSPPLYGPLTSPNDSGEN